MDFTQFIQSEEYKLFPTGKVEDKIKKKREDAKKEKYGVDRDKKDRQAHTMTAVKNLKSKMTDTDKTKQAYTGRDRHKNIAKAEKHHRDWDRKSDKAVKNYDKAAKAAKEGDTEKDDRKSEKGDRQWDKAQRSRQSGRTMDTTRHAYVKSTHAEDDKQAKHNRNVKKAKQSLTATSRGDKVKKLERDLDHSDKIKSSHRRVVRGHGRLPDKVKDKAPKDTIKNDKKKDTPKKKSSKLDSFRAQRPKSESLFTDFLNDQRDPLYEVLGVDDTTTAASKVKCPVGYKWNPMTMRCEPKTEKDSVAGDKGQKMPHGQAHYNVIGSSGYDGGWAFQEPPTSMDMNPDH